MSFTIEPGGPAVLVTAVGAAEGARPAAAALACAGADVDRASLLVDLGGRPPRPTLLASAAAQRLEERLAAHLPDARVAARGQVCHLAVEEGEEGLEVALAAMTVARDGVRVLHVPPASLQPLLDGPLAAPLSGVLLRADLPGDRPLLALAAHDLLCRGLRVAVLKRRLSWVAERRALFGTLPAAAGGLPSRVAGKLLSESCYGGQHDARPQSSSTEGAQEEDHADTRWR
jgi:hypothetical protein